ncbi:hypothetical protein Back11_24770 [Paenibacillus baekrokdamisoli]|uniref:Uncharacterized protein n=1 Tax=Paenibacillus baekrokdamisoli TaxID=1712516 RepID=A0A3G9IS54_9BACL|nr:hypothetical protein [Paenibacillus baekrokdamisoli]MBB3070120.1 threonine/homoserine/homoserine lactone efflux protein [Paenibacillus baekrokdamisoli]BBH21132.1 hypothetical protein Back11_24770 [Paenibacillus baekrokdamisoli]
MPRKVSPLLLVILLLVGAGLVSQMLANPTQMIIPVVIFGAIYLLYKFPPGGARTRTKPRNKPINRKEAQTTKPKSRKNIPFRVIEGGKDDDNLPKYH